MAYSRDSFYRLQEPYGTDGEIALQELSRRKSIPKNRVDPHIEKVAVQIAFDQNAYGQVCWISLILVNTSLEIICLSLVL